MASNCDKCANKTNEVKTGGGISDKGCKIELFVKSAKDLSREVIKSDNCSISIPEISLELSPTTLGSKYTTIEGLLTDIREQLNDNNPFAYGDSSKNDISQKYENFIKELDLMIQAKKFNYSFVLNDPTGNSHMTSTDFNSENKKAILPESNDIKAGSADNIKDDYIDENIKYFYYDRTWQQNEELGLNDMKV
ncbi:unnamed protein product [Gordionus sp. m RMFG-2023]